MPGPRSDLPAAVRLLAALPEWQHDGGRDDGRPHLTRIAEALGVSGERVRKILQAAARRPEDER